MIRAPGVGAARDVRQVCSLLTNQQRCTEGLRTVRRPGFGTPRGAVRSGTVPAPVDPRIDGLSVTVGLGGRRSVVHGVRQVYAELYGRTTVYGRSQRRTD